MRVVNAFFKSGFQFLLLFANNTTGSKMGCAFKISCFKLQPAHSGASSLKPLPQSLGELYKLREPGTVYCASDFVPLPSPCCATRFDSASWEILFVPFWINASKSVNYLVGCLTRPKHVDQTCYIFWKGLAFRLQVINPCFFYTSISFFTKYQGDHINSYALPMLRPPRWKPMHFPVFHCSVGINPQISVPTIGSLVAWEYCTVMAHLFIGSALPREPLHIIFLRRFTNPMQTCA